MNMRNGEDLFVCYLEELVLSILVRRGNEMALRRDKDCRKHRNSKGRTREEETEERAEWKRSFGPIRMGVVYPD